MLTLKEYFSVGEKDPVNVRPGRPVEPATRWRNIHGVGLTKAYDFGDLPTRDRFVIQCIALETHRGKEDVSWSIEGTRVTVLLKSPPVGLTEPMVEFAKTLDSMRRDVAVSTEDVRHDYAF